VNKLVLFPSPIPELQHAPLPFLVLSVGSVPSSLLISALYKTKAHFGPSLKLRSASSIIVQTLYLTCSTSLFGLTIDSTHENLVNKRISWKCMWLSSYIYYYFFLSIGDFSNWHYHWMCSKKPLLDTTSFKVSMKLKLWKGTWQGVHDNHNS
jgi:hypothetical protein